MEAISAIYKNGVLLPAQPLPLTGGTQLTVWIDPTAEMRADLTASDRQFFDRLAAERAEVFRRLAE